MKLRSHRHACLLDGVWRVEWGNEKAPDLIRVQGGMWEHRRWGEGMELGKLGLTG